MSVLPFSQLALRPTRAVRRGSSPTSGFGDAGGASQDPSGPLLILRIYVVCLFVLPSNATIGVLGGAGSAADVVALLGAVLYLGWVLMGAHNPRGLRYPTRLAFLFMWLATSASYVSLQFRERTPTETNGADRWLLFLLGTTAVAFLAAEGLRSFASVIRLMRTLLWAASFCAVVAALQFLGHRDLAQTIGSHLPGFHYVGWFSGVEQRGDLRRVPGTTTNPIEMGADASMLLPIAIAVLVIDRERPLWKRLVPLILIGLCIPMSVSRTAVLATTVAMLFFIPQVRRTLRLAVLALVPVGVGAIGLIVPSYIGTIAGFFSAGGTDTSVRARTGDYTYVAQLVAQHPFFGRGPWAFIPDNALDILDNSYLTWLVEFGWIGLVILVVFYMVLPIAAAVTVRRRTIDPGRRLTAAAISAALGAAALASATYDGLNFPTNFGLEALFIGITGALWVQTAGEPRVDSATFSNDPRKVPMDTLNIWRAIRRNLAAVVIVATLTVAGSLAFYLTRPTRYEVTSTLVLVPPPAQPNAADMELHPEWRKIDTDNPYTRSYDPGTIIQLLIIPTTSDAGRAEVAASGGSTSFQIEPVYSYGFSTAFSKVISAGDSPQQAIRTNQLVVAKMERVLETMQSKEGTSSKYFITTQVAAGAAASPVKRLTPLTGSIGIGLAGMLIAYVAIGIGDAVRISRIDRREVEDAMPEATFLEA